MNDRFKGSDDEFYNDEDGKKEKDDPINKINNQVGNNLVI